MFRKLEKTGLYQMSSPTVLVTVAPRTWAFTALAVRPSQPHSAAKEPILPLPALPWPPSPESEGDPSTPGSCILLSLSTLLS
eukprot:2313657-Amphidinium_carterae.1